MKLSENTYRSRTVGRYVLRIIAAVLSLTMVISSVSVGSLAANDSSEVIVTLGHPITDDDFLQTDGKKIVNRKGQEVSLRGVNLGAWLIQEEWMCPVENSVDNITTFEVLTERFGVEKAYELLNTYADNWITDVDLDNIASMGFNCVRVPFWYRNFYYDDKGTKILDETANGISAALTGWLRSAARGGFMSSSTFTARPDIRITRNIAARSIPAGSSS